MRKFFHFNLFFINPVQLIFALLLVCVVFAIAYLAITQPGTSESTKITPSSFSSPSQAQTPQEITPTEMSVSPNIQPDRAISIVESLKDVQAEKSAAATTNSKFFAEIDSYPTSDNFFYRIHVFVLVPNGDGNTHTATFGWYKVNPLTGVVTNGDFSPSPENISVSP